MAHVVHEIDPNADTVIILKNPTIDFAPWEKPRDIRVPIAAQPVRKRAIENDKGAILGSLKKRRAIETEPKSNLVTALNKTVNNTLGDQAGESLFGGRPPCSKRESSAATTKQHNHDARGLTLKPRMEREEGHIHYHVSSRHLIMASPWFRRALTGEGWTEAVRDDSDGRFHISAEDWDEEALLILLNVVHLRNRQVPRTVSLEMLAKIGVLVDYYQCGEAIELSTDMWIEDLKRGVKVPSTYCRDLILWIWVSWVFNSADQFKKATCIAIKQSTGSIHTMDLPIPPLIIVKIELGRYNAIKGTLHTLHGLLDKYRSDSYKCAVDADYSHICGCILLGALTKGLEKLGFISPPFIGLSLKYVIRKVCAIDSLGWYHSEKEIPNSSECNLGKIIDSAVRKFGIGMQGLSLGVCKETERPNIYVVTVQRCSLNARASPQGSI